MRTKRASWMRAALAPLFVVMVLLGVGAPAHAQDAKARAKQAFASGEDKFKAGDYRGAIAEFTAADALVPSPILSYNIALCHERLGEDAQAIVRYREYLARRPDAGNRAAVEQRIAAAEQRVAAAKAPPPAPAVEGPAAQPPPPTGGKNGRAAAPAPAIEGPAAPPPPTEGPAAPAASRPPATVNDEALLKRVPSRSAGGAPAAVGGTVSGLVPEGGRGEAEPAPEPSPLPADRGTRSATPLYKEWWFWAVVGVSAIILVDMFSDDGASTAAQPGATESGAILFRF